MRTTVYADILFVINFSMDFLILYITGRLLHEKNIPRKLIFAAAAGGVYSVLVLIFGMEKPDCAKILIVH